MRPSNNIGVMFLSEVALGKEFTITRDDCTLKKAPAGYHSVVARGLLEPGKMLWYSSVLQIYKWPCS